MFSRKEEALRHVLDELGVRYSERNGWQAIRCISPEHNDRHKSGSLNLGRGRFRCHGCGLAGDGYDMLQTLLGISGKQFHEGDIPVEKIDDDPWF